MRYCVGASAYYYHVDVGAPVGGVFQLAGCFGGSYTVGDGMEADIVRSRRKCLGFVLHGDELASRALISGDVSSPPLEIPVPLLLAIDGATDPVHVHGPVPSA